MNIENLISENAKAAAEQKELDDLVSALGENKLKMRKPCMEGTRSDILQAIETEVKNAGGHNIIWIRGSPGVGKSALAASILNRLEDQNRRVISFRFDRAQSTTITTDALWRVVACDLARLYPSFRQHLAKDNKRHNSSDINRLFKNLIEIPLSSLGGVLREELPVIIIDALDECGGLRHDLCAKENYEGLLRTLKRWVQVDHLKKFKLVITSRPENAITNMFPDSISTHGNIPSGSDVKPQDSASDDICAFLKSRFDTMGVEPAWIAKALDYLVPRATGIFIWATTAAEFLQVNPQERFSMLQSKGDGKGLRNLYSLYSTVVKTSFGCDLEEEEIKAVTSVMGAMIFAKQPLDDDALIMLTGVKSRNMLQFIRRGLVSVIDPGPILHFHHRSFEDFVLSSFFLQDLPEFSAVQDQGRHEYHLTVLCLNTMVSSVLRFNICDLKTSSIGNRDISAADKSAISPLLLYSSLFWADHLVCTPCEVTLMEVVKFLMYEKLLFWMEVMSLSGRAHEAIVILKRVLAWPALKVCCSLVYHGIYLMLAG